MVADALPAPLAALLANAGGGGQPWAAHEGVALTPRMVAQLAGAAASLRELHLAVTLVAPSSGGGGGGSWPSVAEVAAWLRQAYAREWPGKAQVLDQLALPGACPCSPT